MQSSVNFRKGTTKFVCDRIEQLNRHWLLRVLFKSAKTVTGVVTGIFAILLITFTAGASLGLMLAGVAILSADGRTTWFSIFSLKLFQGDKDKLKALIELDQFQTKVLVDETRLVNSKAHAVKQNIKHQSNNILHDVRPELFDFYFRLGIFLDVKYWELCDIANGTYLIRFREEHESLALLMEAVTNTDVDEMEQINRQLNQELQEMEKILETLNTAPMDITQSPDHVQKRPTTDLEKAVKLAKTIGLQLQR